MHNAHINAHIDINFSTSIFGVLVGIFLYWNGKLGVFGIGIVCLLHEVENFVIWMF